MRRCETCRSSIYRHVWLDWVAQFVITTADFVEIVLDRMNDKSALTIELVEQANEHLTFLGNTPRSAVWSTIRLTQGPRRNARQCSHRLRQALCRVRDNLLQQSRQRVGYVGIRLG